jgi:hypothetical protein
MPEVTMPLTYTIDASRRIIVARASGVLTEDDLRSTRILMRGDPGFNRNFGQLLDLRAADEVTVSVPAMARIAAASAFAPGVRRAFVGVTDAQYNMARTFAMLSEPHDQLVHVFRDISVAEAWLMEGAHPRTSVSQSGFGSSRPDSRRDSKEGNVSRM